MTICKETFNLLCERLGLGNLEFSTSFLHHQIFKCTISVSGYELASASDLSADSAENKAAKRAYEALSDIIDMDSSCLLMTHV